jgi:hypothetical protein
MPDLQIDWRLLTLLPLGLAFAAVMIVYFSRGLREIRQRNELEAARQRYKARMDELNRRLQAATTEFDRRRHRDLPMATALWGGVDRYVALALEAALIGDEKAVMEHTQVAVEEAETAVRASNGDFTAFGAPTV